MQHKLLSTGFLLTSLFLVSGNIPHLNAQITNEIKARINHSFIVGNTTLPPGRYTFRMMNDSDLTAMTVTSEDGKTAVDFLVRQSTDDHTPKRSELLFRKYGPTEFLSKIYQKGSKNGVAVDETSKREARLAKQSKAVEHTEEQDEGRD